MPGPSPDRLPFADGGACFERAGGQAVQAAVSGNDRSPGAAGSHHGVDGAASEIEDRKERCGRRGRTAHRTQREEDRKGMATIVLSPFISAIRARQPGQRLRWSSTRVRRLTPSSLPRYARKSCRNSAQVALEAFDTVSQTRPRAVSSVRASTFSSFISCNARFSRSSDVAHLSPVLTHEDADYYWRAYFAFAASTLAWLRRGAPVARLALQFVLQPVADPVEPDGHVVSISNIRPALRSTAPRRGAAETGWRPRGPGRRWRAEAVPSAAVGAGRQRAGPFRRKPIPRAAPGGAGRRRPR